MYGGGARTHVLEVKAERASVCPPSLFQVERRLFKDSEEKALPQAVLDDQIDILMIQVKCEIWE